MGSSAKVIVTRREFALAAGSLAVAAAIPGSAPGQTAAASKMEEAIRETVGDAEVTPGKVSLTVPPLVENGNVVPVAIAVESPMNDTDYVRRIHLFNEKNPQAYVATFYLGPRAGRASVATRIRLSDSQKLVAIAELGNGSLWSDTADVIVTLAACVEG